MRGLGHGSGVGRDLGGKLWVGGQKFGIRTRG